MTSHSCLRRIDARQREAGMNRGSWRPDEEPGAQVKVTLGSSVLRSRTLQAALARSICAA